MQFNFDVIMLHNGLNYSNMILQIDKNKIYRCTFFNNRYLFCMVNYTRECFIIIVFSHLQKYSCYNLLQTFQDFIS